MLCARLFKIDPAIEAHSPDLNAMLDRGDAALIIGENEFAARQCQVKDLASGASATASYDGADATPLIGMLRSILSA